MSLYGLSIDVSSSRLWLIIELIDGKARAAKWLKVFLRLKEGDKYALRRETNKRRNKNRSKTKTQIREETRKKSRKEKTKHKIFFLFFSFLDFIRSTPGRCIERFQHQSKLGFYRYFSWRYGERTFAPSLYFLSLFPINWLI